MRMAGQGTLCAGTPGGGARAVATFPSVAVLPDGTLLALYRIGRSKDSDGTVTELRRSSDGGTAWSAAETPFSSYFGGVRGSLQVVYATSLGPGTANWSDNTASDQLLVSWYW